MFDILEEPNPQYYTSNRHVPTVETHGYMGSVLDTETLRLKVLDAVEALKRGMVEFDAVAFRGISGAILGPQIALALNKSMILVRKPNDGSHAQQNANATHSHILTPLVEGDVDAKTYIIVDDFQSSGTTARAIRDAIAEVIPKAKCLGVCEVTKLYPGMPAIKRIAYDSNLYV